MMQQSVLRSTKLFAAKFFGVDDDAVDIGEDLELVRHPGVIAIGGQAVADAAVALLRFDKGVRSCARGGGLADPAVGQDGHRFPSPECGRGQAVVFGSRRRGRSARAAAPFLCPRKGGDPARAPAFAGRTGVTARGSRPDRPPPTGPRASRCRPATRRRPPRSCAGCAHDLAVCGSWAGRARTG